uniref:Agenet domain-containing protein n=1 Tax=Brassica oleracea var. oleracea TaxID=109376 RepID=A0A0D3B3W2_BRAOL
MAQPSLPFKVGEIVEVRSFEVGYRGAWFRCKEEPMRALKKQDYSHGERLLPQREITLTRRDCFSKRESALPVLESSVFKKVSAFCAKGAPRFIPKRLGPLRRGYVFGPPWFRPKRLGPPRRSYVLEALALVHLWPYFEAPWLHKSVPYSFYTKHFLNWVHGHEHKPVTMFDPQGEHLSAPWRKVLTLSTMCLLKPREGYYALSQTNSQSVLYSSTVVAWQTSNICLLNDAARTNLIFLMFEMLSYYQILNIYTKEGKLFYSLKYLDYDGEDIHHTQVYQQFEDGEEWLMVRPSYPPCYQEREVRKIEANQAPLVVVHGSWQVGDLVDWDRDGCFWCVTVLTVKRNEPFQIELFPPPLGEGETYKALRKDVRPTLDWSPEDGWTLPSTDGRKSQSVRLVKREKGVDHVAGKEKTERAKKQKTERHRQHRTERDAQQKTEGDMQQEKGNGEIRQNIDESDSIEAAVYDLEELIVRIEWIKNMLSPDVGGGSTWKYQDYRPSSK